MKKLSEKRKRYLDRSRKRSFRKKVSRNRRFRKNRIQNHPFLRGPLPLNARSEYLDQRLKPLTLHASSDFSLLDNTSEVISFISQLKNCRNLVGVIDHVEIDLSKVQNLDVGTLNLLLSSVKELTIYGMTVRGSMPINKRCERIIYQSGYLEHMTEVSKELKKSMAIHRTENAILMRGKDKTANADVGMSIKNAMRQLIGTEMHYPPIYGIVQEMNGNSVEHAYKNNKHWLFGVNYLQDGNKIAFTFTDNGYGVLGTLEKRFGKKVFDALGLKTNEEILDGIFNREYNSRFKSQFNRNKGLPVIKKAQEEGNVKNLIVITNDVYLHLGDSLTRKLDDSFSGTFYYWEIDKEIVEKWQKK